MPDTSMTTETPDDAAFLEKLGGGLFDGDESAEASTAEVAEAVTEVAATTEAATTEVAEAVQTEEQPAATATETTTEAATETPAQTQTEEETEDEPQSGKVPQMRFRPVNDQKTIEAARLMKAGLSYDEIQDVLAKRSGHTEEAHEEQGPDIAAMQARLAELDAVLEKAGEDESVMTKELARAIRERGEVAADFKLAQRDIEARAAAREQERQATYETAYNESTDAAVELYPDAENPNSALSQRIAAEVQEILDNPNHPLRGNPEAPMILTARHARKLGIPPQTGPRPSTATSASTTAAAPNTQQQTATPARAATTEATLPRTVGLTPATGASRTAPPGPVPTAQQAEAEIHRKFTEAKSDDEAAGLLAASLFGAATPASPFA